MKPLLALTLLVVSMAAWGQETEGDQVMVRRGDVEITAAEFDARIFVIPEKDRKPFLSYAKRVNDTLAQMLLREQLILDARTAGFDQGDLMAVVMRQGGENALADTWLEHYVSTAPDADYEMLAHEMYLSNATGFMTEESVDVTHLLVSTRERDVAEAREMAEDLLLQIQADPARFDNLVLAHSEDPSASSNRGRFQGVTRGQMVKPFEEAAFDLAAGGAISGLVQTQYGFHIIRLDGRVDARRMTFEEVKSRLLRAAEEQHRARVRNDYLSNIGKAPVEFTEGAVEDMLQRYFSNEELVEMGIMGPDYLEAQ